MKRRTCSVTLRDPAFLSPEHPAFLQYCGEVFRGTPLLPARLGKPAWELERKSGAAGRAQIPISLLPSPYMSTKRRENRNAGTLCASRSLKPSTSSDSGRMAYGETACGLGVADPSRQPAATRQQLREGTTTPVLAPESIPKHLSHPRVIEVWRRS